MQFKAIVIEIKGRACNILQQIHAVTLGNGHQGKKFSVSRESISPI